MLLVVQIGHAPGADLFAWVAHGAGVRPLQPRPVVDRPRVRPPPAVHHLAAVALGQDHVVDAAHAGEGTDTAGKATGEFLHLANLALILVHIIVADVEGRRGVVLVHILTAREDAQLLRAAVGVRRPRRHPRLDGGPVGHHQPLAFRCHQRRAQHTLQHVGDARAELRHDLVAAHHRLTGQCRVGGALSWEVVDL